MYLTPPLRREPLILLALRMLAALGPLRGYGVAGVIRPGKVSGSYTHLDHSFQPIRIVEPLSCDQAPPKRPSGNLRSNVAGDWHVRSRGHFGKGVILTPMLSPPASIGANRRSRQVNCPAR